MIVVLLGAILAGVSILRVDPLGLRAAPNAPVTLSGDVHTAPPLTVPSPEPTHQPSPAEHQVTG
jgi:hypothetical protein